MGIYATRKFATWKDHDAKIKVIGLYYIADGGHPRLTYLPLN
jgi:hypothetical protein